MTIAEAINNAETVSPNEPEPLYRPLPPTPDYPIAALGDVLGKAAEALHNDVQAPLAMCGQSLLAAASLAAMPHVDVGIDGRRIPTSLYCVTMGETGERKSGIDRLATWPIEQHQKGLGTEYRQALTEYETEAAIHRIKRQKAERQKDMDAIENDLRSLGDEPTAPVQPILLCSDPTMEGITKLLERQPYTGLFSDEGGRMLGGHAMSKDNKLRTITLLSKLWDGRPVDRVRAGDAATVLYGRRMAMHLLMQPAVAQELLADPLAQDQGILGRILLSYPDSMVGRQPYIGKDAGANPHVKRNQAKLLSAMKTPVNADEDGALQPALLHLSGEAKAIYVGFVNHINEQLSGEDLRAVRGLACKAAELSLRIAGVLHWIENPSVLSIGGGTMAGAVELMNYYLAEAIRLQAGSVVNKDLEMAERLVHWLRERGERIVYPRDVYKDGPSRSIRNKASALKILRLLEDHGYLMPLPEESLGNRKQGWQVVDVAQVATVAQG